MKNKIIKKPWGSEELLEHNKKYVLKKLFMKKDCRCSLQYHKFKCETIFVVSGKLKVIYNTIGDFNTYSPGEYLTLKPYAIHRMCGLEDTVYLEASTPELDDVVRMEDDYNRI